MVLVDARRIIVDANGAYLKLLSTRRDALVGRPLYEFIATRPIATPAKWEAALARGHFAGQAELICSNGDHVGVQWGATVEVVTGRRLVLFVALSTSRWGARFRRTTRPRSSSSVRSGSCGPRSTSTWGGWRISTAR